ncbi:MAG: DUF4168 domain-containing protein [Thermodesulfobacteriota bacterium]
MTARIMQRKTMWKVITMAAALCFLAAAPLAAQEGDQEQQEYEYQQPEQTAEDFSDSDLEKFAQAQTEVDDIRSEYSDELSGVEDTEKARELQDKYADQMVKAIEDAGLDVQTYNEISMALQNDPELQEKIDEMGN